MPRNSKVDAEITRQRIVSSALSRASVDGLGGLTIGTLSASLGLSKAGVVGPFGSKADLQAATLEAALDRFFGDIVAPCADAQPGLARLNRLLDRWVDYIVASPFPNGCFLTAASCELDGQPGPLRDRLAEAVTAWRVLLVDQIEIAQVTGDVSPEVDATDAVIVLSGLAMAANQEIELLDDDPPTTGARARRLMRAALRL
ncbi:MAG TPA: TetR/AcrR family transcriptional regulator [Gordonia sp. (in: high G+C Gram-positive bacteria)]|uniref:TetR/AcrR family transcriptional regulator n=1 Tax=unclassified Gordonia (in: high G+C Gram-positive bacteria) TaxID=2657482 RepID=UPI000FB74A0B|nr:MULTISPECIES: TetR/AcrR family transcriptional regulator [unclassified Gordonia (in: high G+C Gram-positive bacteria)]RTL09691.1 MAG: TetR/AcrR family transcriptional regulator [Acidimicrobiia bacterium]HNP59085.1 TetR/AcrR family transcriptional regulator [Gordonia sp. (in: high G+C Gram-positive bacteria)]HRC51713.1 TetR/AcrR family transcriptional regulator [Gordonia sp. (in: high G+C Gram-positive bacteria)]